MSLRDVLVVVDASDTGTGAMQSAANLAADNEAHLTGLYLGHDPLLGFAQTQLPPDLLQLHQENLARAERGAREEFDRACRAQGLGGEWRAVAEAQVSALILNSRYADLVAMSARAPRPSDIFAHRYADSVVIAAGRPVLMLPESWTWGRGCERIMVAWESSREATRAVHDAMPLLEKAGEVVVVEVTGRDDAGARDPAADIGRHLARHGVAVEAAHAVKGNADIGEQLLRASVDHGAHLLVAGAYGHSRVREYALGGVTRYLMTHSTIPLLLSH